MLVLQQRMFARVWMNITEVLQQRLLHIFLGVLKWLYHFMIGKKQNSLKNI